MRIAATGAWPGVETVLRKEWKFADIPSDILHHQSLGPHMPQVQAHPGGQTFPKTPLGEVRALRETASPTQAILLSQAARRRSRSAAFPPGVTGGARSEERDGGLRFANPPYGPYSGED